MRAHASTESQFDAEKINENFLKRLKVILLQKCVQKCVLQFVLLESQCMV